MFKTVGQQVCAFDLEWVPDPQAGRLAYGLPPSMADEEVYEVMWQQAGATPETPRPYLKTALCRVVSVAAVIREQRPHQEPRLRLSVLPRPTEGALSPMNEGELIATFLGYVGQRKPQLVGFNSTTSDLPILLQRGIAAGITAAEFCDRPHRPWEGMDYFSRSGDAHVDLKTLVSGWGIGTPSLHELATVMGIPGKLGTDGASVVDLWVEDNLEAIVAYNQYDALTTYLIWLRTALFAGFFSPQQYGEETARVEALLATSIAQGQHHLESYQQRWNDLRQLHNALPIAEAAPAPALGQVA